MRISLSAGLVVVIMSSLLASRAYSQWTVTYLQPFGPLDSFARGDSGFDEAGLAFVGSFYHAARWTGSAASFVDMHPAGYKESHVVDTDGVNQVGGATILFNEHAAIWSGTSASFTDLHPLANPDSSRINDTFGTLQAGEVTLTSSGPGHAALWHLTAASFVDIHPGGYVNSEGFGTDGSKIVGSAETGAGDEHAGLWSFGPDLFTDLHPTGASFSVANDVDGAIQVGLANFSGSTHGALWSGAAATFVDMNPPGAGGSVLRGVDGGFQIGDAFVGPGATFKAGIWSGTASSFVNLHSFLTPFTYSSSEAWGVWTDGTTVRVVGSAFNSTLTRSEAILWTMTIPEPGLFSLIGGAGLCGIGVRRRRNDFV